MHTLTPPHTSPATSAKDAIRHEKAAADELADLEAQMASAAHERWLTAQSEAIRKTATDPDEARRMKAYLVSVACGKSHGQALYSAHEVEAWLRRAEELGCAEPLIGPKVLVRLARIESVPNARLREAYLRLGTRATAEEVGFHGGSDPDGVVHARPACKRTSRASSPSTSEMGGGEVYERTGSRIADQLGYRLDYLERVLGIQASTPSGDGDDLPSLRNFVPYEMAVRLADALGMTYHEAGL